MLQKRGGGDELPVHRDSVHVQNYSMRLPTRRREDHRSRLRGVYGVPVCHRNTVSFALEELDVVTFSDQQPHRRPGPWLACVRALCKHE